MNDADVYAIKAATKRAVKLCGGVEYAADPVGVAKSRLSNYYSPDHTCTIQARGILGIEREIEKPVITAELARLQGYYLVPIDGAERTTCEPEKLLLDATKELGEAVDAVRSMKRGDMAKWRDADAEVGDVKRVIDDLVDAIARLRPGFMDAEPSTVTTLREARR